MPEITIEDTAGPVVTVEEGLEEVLEEEEVRTKQQKVVGIVGKKDIMHMIVLRRIRTD